MRVVPKLARELGQARVRAAGVQHVLRHAEVGVEDPPGELRHVPDLGELPLGMVLPRAGRVGDQGLQVGELAALLVRIADEGGGPGGAPARPREVARVPGDEAPGEREPGLLGVRDRGHVTQDLRRRRRLARGGEGACLLDPEVGEAVTGSRFGGCGVRARRPPIAGGVAQVGHQHEQVVPLPGRRDGEGLLRPALAVRVRAHRGGPAGRRGEERHGIAGAAGLEQMVGDLFRRPAALTHAGRGAQVHLDEVGRIELPAGGVAQKRVAEP